MANKAGWSKWSSVLALTAAEASAGLGWAGLPGLGHFSWAHFVLIPHWAS